MKKALSLVLAVAMMLSMAAVAFAADDEVTMSGMKFDEYVDSNKGAFDVLQMSTFSKWDNASKDVAVNNAYGPFKYSSDDKKLTAVSSIQYGKTAYYVLTDAKDGLIVESDVVRNLKIKADWDMGDLVDKVSVVKKKIGGTGSDGVYAYLLAIDVKSSSTTADDDIIGTLTLNNSKRDFKVDDLDLKIDLNVNWDNSYIGTNKETFTITSSDELEDLNLAVEKYYSLKIDSDLYKDDEATLELGDDEWTFTSDFRGQGKILIYFDKKFNSAIADQYPMANLDFFNGNGAKFNKTGEMFIAAEPDSYLYQINADGTLSAVKGADYDDYDEGFYFYTRTLGKYVVSDEELDLSASAPVVDVTPGPVNPANPSTGAAA